MTCDPGKRLGTEKSNGRLLDVDTSVILINFSNVLKGKAISLTIYWPCCMIMKMRTFQLFMAIVLEY